MKLFPIYILLLLLASWANQAEAQILKKNPFAKKKTTPTPFKGDFLEVKVPKKLWIPADTALLNIKLTPIETGIANMGLQDTTVQAIGIGGAALAPHLTSPAFNYRGKLSKKKNRVNPTPAPFADTLNIHPLLHEHEVFTGIDLAIHKSLMREDTTNLYEAQEDGMVEVSEELAIDCVWVKLTDYYAVWRSDEINPYNIDINNFKDSVNIVLYDSLSDFKWSPPLASNKVSSEFGHRWGRWHHGIDLDLEIGDPVLASFDGIIRITDHDRGGYGNHIVIRHYNGLETLYGHLHKTLVDVGDYVKAGDLIGYGGNTGRSTGPHLHYEIRYQGYAFDPRLVYDFAANRILTNSITIRPEFFSHLMRHRQSIWYKIKRGDTLGEVARRYGVSTQQLYRLNRLKASSVLRVGQRIRLR
jgi:hypothetical protein